jgi:hypothetical protein
MLSSKDVKIHSRAILAQFLAAADLPAGDNTARLVFLQTSLVGEEACKLLADLSRLRSEARNGAGGFESCWEDCAESARHGCCGLFGGLGLLAAGREGEGFFVHPVMVDEGGLRRLVSHFFFSDGCVRSWFGFVFLCDVLWFKGGSVLRRREDMADSSYVLIISL